MTNERDMNDAMKYELKFGLKFDNMNIRESRMKSRGGSASTASSKNNYNASSLSSRNGSSGKVIVRGEECTPRTFRGLAAIKSRGQPGSPGESED